MNIFSSILAILGFGLAIIGLLIFLKHPFAIRYIRPAFWGSFLGLCLIVLGLLISWSMLALLFSIPSLESAIHIVGLLILVISIIIGITAILGRPLLITMSTSSRRQKMLYGTYTFAFGVLISFGLSFKNYLNLSSNQEATILLILFIIAIIPLILFTLVRYIENT